MARYRKKSRKSGKSKKVPIALAAPVAMAAVRAYNDTKAGHPEYFLNSMAGMDGSGKFNMDVLVSSYSPFVAGIVVHKAAGYLGLNRALSRIPFVSI